MSSRGGSKNLVGACRTGPNPEMTTDEAREFGELACQISQEELFGVVKLVSYGASWRAAIDVAKSVKSAFSRMGRELMSLIMDGDRPYVGTQLEKAFLEGDAEFLRRAANASERKKGYFGEWGTMRDMVAMTLVSGWIYCDLDGGLFLFPLCLWADEAVADFFEFYYKKRVTVDHVRRRRREWRLHQPGFLLVKRCVNLHDGIRLEYSARHRAG